MNLRFGKIVLFLFFILCSSTLLSQAITPKYIDSLYEVAYQRSLDGKIKESQTLANLCTDLSIKINYKKGLLQAEKIHADCKTMLGAKEEDVLKSYQTLLKRAKQERFNDLAAVILFELAVNTLSGEYTLSGEHGGFFKNIYYEKIYYSSISEAEVLNCGKDSLRLLGDINILKGIYYENIDSIALSIKYYLSAYKIYNSLKDEYRIGKSLLNLYVVSYNNGLYSRAIVYSSDYLSWALKYNNPNKITYAFDYKVVLCAISEQWDSVKYYVAQEAIVAKKFPNDIFMKDLLIIHRAMLYDYDNKSDSALISLNSLKDYGVFSAPNLLTIYILNYLQLGREAEAKIKLDEFSQWVKENRILYGVGRLQYQEENLLALLTFAYNLYKETKTNSWIPAFKKHIVSLADRTLLLQGQNKISQIFGFDENFSKSDYLVVQARVKAQEAEIKLRQKNVNYLVAFSIVSLILLSVVLFFYLKIKRLVARKRRTNEQLAQNNSYLQMYDRAIGHDLASPLALISDCAQTLKEGSNSEAFEQQLLDGISEQSALALQQVRGLLRLGISSDSVQHLALSSQLLPLVQEGQRLAGVFDNPVRVQGAEGLPLVLMNADALKQIFQNIFSNSLKHSGRGKAVEMEVKGEYKANSKFCTISISDNGSGISSRARASIFDLGTTSTTTPSTGLGLAICKVLMDKFGGSIEYKSGSSTGPLFVLSLKVA